MIINEQSIQEDRIKNINVNFKPSIQQEICEEKAFENLSESHSSPRFGKQWPEPQLQPSTEPNSDHESKLKKDSVIVTGLSNTT